MLRVDNSGFFEDSVVKQRAVAGTAGQRCRIGLYIEEYNRADIYYLTDEKPREYPAAMFVAFNCSEPLQMLDTITPRIGRVEFTAGYRCQYFLSSARY
jgi:hypothetical protein